MAEVKRSHDGYEAHSRGKLIGAYDLLGSRTLNKQNISPIAQNCCMIREKISVCHDLDMQSDRQMHAKGP
jgi:hypothetical protein